jgi:hypothetical protein
MKIRIIVCISAALIVFTGASVWEGAASIAPNGELPDEGYYTATNSFPRNTVVDITNLENGKSIRVIVASGLDTPGLLAVLSRDAAEVIGIRSRSIGRIRMTQPSDPVAFSRFTEGLASNGDPDYDPRALVASDPVAKSLYSNTETPPVTESPAAPAAPASPALSTAPPVTEAPAASAVTAVPAVPAAPEEAPPRDQGLPPAVLSVADPDYSEYEDIVDIPDAYTPPEASSPDEGITREPDLAWVYDGPGEPAKSAGALVMDDPAIWEEKEKEAPETSLPPLAGSETGLRIAEEPDLSEPEAPAPDTYDYALVPAEERPPEEYPGYAIPPEAEISSAPEHAAGPSAVTDGMDESFFVSPPENAGIPPHGESPGAFITPSLPNIFSVPLIGSLERGKYYLQLGAYTKADAAESELDRIGKTYPLAIQNGGSSENPVYRILLGPVNLGESGALLQRFRSIGYGDAFVRSGS